MHNLQLRDSRFMFLMWRTVVQLIESGKAEGVFPSDVIERAKRYLAAMPGGTGAYSDSRGAMVLRKDIAKVPS